MRRACSMVVWIACIGVGCASEGTLGSRQRPYTPISIVDSGIPRWHMDSGFPPADVGMVTDTSVAVDSGMDVTVVPNDVAVVDSAVATDTAATNDVAVDTPPPPAPPNDLPSTPAILAAAGGALDYTLAGATQQGSGCGAAEVYFRFSIPENRIVAVDTFGTSTLDTMISYRGADCLAAAACNADQSMDGNDSCSSVAAGYIHYLAAGTHCFAVSLANSAVGAAFRLSWGSIVAPPEANVFGLAAQSSANYTRALTADGVVTPSCQPSGETSTAEHLYVIGLCPSARLRFAAHTCGATSADTVVSVVSTSGISVCNDNSEASCSPTSGSRVQADVTSGAAVVGVMVDGKSVGNYALHVDISQL